MTTDNPTPPSSRDESEPPNSASSPPSHPHPRAIQWLIFGAALMPFFVTILYMTFKPKPKLLKRNFPPPATSDATPATDAPTTAQPDAPQAPPAEQP
ncbi:MAG: hypothetical protein AAFS10_15020 [Myxococcota bacterium]